jgi:hypothetical protein
MSVFKGFGVGSFRSFVGEETALVGPFEKIHLLTGQNNAGKSSLLDFAYRVLPVIRDGLRGIPSNEYPFCKDDIPKTQDDDSGSYQMSLAFDTGALLAKGGRDPFLKDSLRTMFASDAFSRGSKGVTWVDYLVSQKRNNPRIMVDSRQYEGSGLSLNLPLLSQTLTTQASSSNDDNLNSIFGALVPLSEIPKTAKIGAVRKISKEGPFDLNQPISGGIGLGKALFLLSNPSTDDQVESGRRWNAFLEFVGDVLNDQKANVRIVAEDETVTVETSDTPYLSLANLGTGIEELIIMAAVVACSSNCLICVEEPEIHLHPALQARLLEYFKTIPGDNRFLITTHSPTLINSSGVSVTQVEKDGGCSQTRQVTGLVEMRDVLDDLGVHPSDVLQTNYVLWVEGPSDRIYVNTWIHVEDPRLVEGIHYSIMLYGGKLLSALDASPTDRAEKLVGLFKINTHFGVLMDSDREGSHRPISKTKTRIKSECESAEAFVWITDGRTIENYIPAKALGDAIKELYPGKTYLHQLDDPYVCPLSFKFEGQTVGPDKIKIARYITENSPQEKLATVGKHIRCLVTAIQKANGLE